MPHTSGFLISFCAAVTLTAAPQDSPKPQFTARELFYSASQAPKASPAAEPKVEPVKPPVKKSTTTVAKRAPADPPKIVPASAHSQSAQADYSALIVPQQERPATAPAPIAGPPLGLKYSILKKSGDDMVEVPVTSAFRAGDRVQFNVQTNGPGYLYIISQGSSGTWMPIFPSPEVEDGNNRVEGWHGYAMPPQSRIVFDEQTGTEKIFIVFSREAEPDLESLIYSLKGKGQPSKTVDPQPRPKTVIASASIDDSTVGRLRDTYSRDLIIEKVSPNSPGERKENAVYIVNPSGSTDSRIVADLSLVHQ